MTDGRLLSSPIVEACRFAQDRAGVDVRVYLTRWWPKVLLSGAARRIFQVFSLHRSPQRSAVLIFIHERHRRFTVVYDQGWATAVSPTYWTDLSTALRDDLLSTYWEKAVAIAVRTIGTTALSHFKEEEGEATPLPLR